ncbi:MAG: bifunctional oligoribonuclease/PAP phosphatase NrnA [bacterium]
MGPLPGRRPTTSAELPALNPASADLTLLPRGFCEAPERLRAYFETLEGARGSRQLIIIKGHPDPDSIATAMAQRHLSQQFDIESTILYFDEISHPENRALVKALDTKLKQYREDIDFGDYDYMSFVDTQTPDLPIRVADPPPVLTFVDHHKVVGGFDARFVDIREDCGATSSIYAEYLEHSPYGLRHGVAEHARIATALMHGVRTDTDNLLLGMPIDFRAGAYLRQFLDNDLLRLIGKQSITARTMEVIQRGLNSKVIKGTFLLAGVGFVREEDRDGIAQTSDFLLRHEGVETAVVYGIVNGDVVDGSLRTNSATIDPDTFLKTLFGTDQVGRHYGGGRRNKGGFRIPLGIFDRCRDRDALWAIVKKTIDDLVFEKIGVEGKRGQKD